MRKELNLEMLMEDVKMLKEFGFTQEQAMSMAREKQGFEPLATSVAVAKQEVEEPAKEEPPKPKFYKYTNEELTWSKDGNVCNPSYPKCGKLTGKAIWYKNYLLIKEHFGDDVNWCGGDHNKKKGYHCNNEEIAKELMKFKLSNGVTVDEWNAWAEYKVEGHLKQADYYESLKVSK